MITNKKMLLYNPTKSNLTVVIKGREFSIKAEDSIEIDNEHGLFWKNNLHGFLEIRESKEVISEEVAPEEVISKIENVQIEKDNTEESVKEDNKIEEASSEDKVEEEIIEKVVEEIVVVSTPKKTNKSNKK